MLRERWGCGEAFVCFICVLVNWSCTSFTFLCLRTHWSVQYLNFQCVAFEAIPWESILSKNVFFAWFGNAKDTFNGHTQTHISGCFLDIIFFFLASLYSVAPWQLSCVGGVHCVNMFWVLDGPTLHQTYSGFSLDALGHKTR